MQNRMTRIIILLILVAACALVGYGGFWFWNDTTKPEVTLRQTPNGTAFYHVPMDQDAEPRVVFSITWPHVSAYTGGANPALAYIATEAVLSGGTETLKAQEVLELLNDLNVQGTLVPAADHVYGRLSFPAENLDRVIPVVAEILAKPQFEEQWLARIKAGKSDALKESMRRSNDRMWRASRMVILGEQPLRAYLDIPDLSVIDDIDQDAVRAWHRETIVRTGATIVVAGALSADAAAQAVDTLLADLPTGSSKTAAEITTDFSPKTVLLHMPEAEKTTLGFIGALPPTTEGGSLVDLVAMNFFARAGEGPLFDAVRNQLRASYGLQAGYGNYNRGVRFMVIAGEVETEKLAEVRDVVLETYADFRTNPEFAGFAELRDSIADHTRSNLKNPAAVANLVTEAILDQEGTETILALDQRIAAITEDEVRDRMTTVYPKAEELMVFAASPDDQALPGACVITEIAQAQDC